MQASFFQIHVQTKLTAKEFYNELLKHLKSLGLLVSKKMGINKKLDCEIEKNGIGLQKLFLSKICDLFVRRELTNDYVAQRRPKSRTRSQQLAKHYRGYALV